MSGEPATPAQTIRFVSGIRYELAAEVRQLDRRRALVLSTPEQSEIALDMAKRLGAMASGVYSGATMHTPVDITEDALKYAESVGVDCLVSVGGGSTTGLGKALSIRMGLPHISIPTTYAGSEATPILGETADGVKSTLLVVLGRRSDRRTRLELGIEIDLVERADRRICWQVDVDLDGVKHL